MNTQEIIEKLKDPKQAQPLCLRSKEEQKILIKAAPKNCLFLCDRLGWTENYILKPDYEPESEWMDVEVKVAGIRLQVHVPDRGMWPIQSLPSFVKFIKFWRADDESTQAPEDVATLIYEGKKVFARFRKE